MMLRLDANAYNKGALPIARSGRWVTSLNVATTNVHCFNIAIAQEYFIRSG